MLAGDVLDVVSLVEDDHLVLGNDGAKVVLLKGQIREEQVVVDDDDVGFAGSLVHLRDETAVELIALLAGAKFAPRIEFGPETAVCGERPQLGAIAGIGLRFPLADHREFCNFFETVKDWPPLGVDQLLAAKEVCAPFHVSDSQFAPEGLFEERNVLLEELFLQVFSSRRNDDATAPGYQRNQVRQSFPGARAGLDNQVSLFVNRGLDLKSHFELAGTELPLAEVFRQHPATAKKLADTQS